MILSKLKFVFGTLLNFVREDLYGIRLIMQKTIRWVKEMVYSVYCKSVKVFSNFIIIELPIET